MRDPRPSAQLRRLRPVAGPPHATLEERPAYWDPREVHDLIRQFFASPFGMAQCDDQRHDLLTEIVDIALRVAGDPTRWDGPLVTAVLVAEMPHQPHIPGRDRRQVPDLLRGFIGFCAAERGLDADDADDALGMIAYWSADWSVPDVLILDPWSAERLWSLDTDPLVDEPFDRSGLPPGAADAVDEVLTLIDGACAVLVDPELRIAARRLTARVAAGDAAVLVDQPDRAVSAAVLIWLVGRANGAFGRGRARVMDLMAHLGLRQASPAGWARPYLRAAGLREHGHRRRLTLGPELLTSTHRRSVIELRDRCHRVVGDSAALVDVLQIARDTGGDPRAPSTGQRAPAPRRAR